MKLLLIDDDLNLNRVLTHQLEKQGYQVIARTSGEDGLKAFEKNRIHAVITDIQMPGLSGIELLKQIRKKDTEVPIIIITAYGTIEGALEACHLGADDYLTKPFDIEQLIFTLEKMLRLRELERENSALRRAFYDQYAFKNMVASSTLIRNVIHQAAQVAQTEATVLITGESGTGKELLAKGIHLNSPRREKQFVTVNCPSIPASLMESELFGHKKGAFTGAICDRVGKFEQAHGGTLFLDEIGDLPLDLQSKLLRVLQNHTIERIGSNVEVSVDVRVVSATNQNLEKLLEQGKFREDLYFRLNVVPIHIPPLREHADDIPFLIDFFLRKAKKRNISVSKEALAIMQKYHWPGNVRELENMISRILIFLDQDTITPDQLPQNFGSSSVQAGSDEIVPLAQAEKKLIEQALSKTSGNKSKAARLLGIPRHVLLYRLKKLDF